MSTALSIAIGRNVAGIPMGLDRWRQFQSDVRTILGATWSIEAEEYIDHADYGTDPNPVEESFRLWAIPNAGVSIPRHYEGLKENLRGLAREYGQWGIHVSLGMSDIVRADP